MKFWKDIFYNVVRNIVRKAMKFNWGTLKKTQINRGIYHIYDGNTQYHKTVSSSQTILWIQCHPKQNLYYFGQTWAAYFFNVQNNEKGLHSQNAHKEEGR